MQPALVSESAALGARFQAIRGATERLAAPLSPEDCALQSAPFASPVKWHLAHTTWFFETFVLADFTAGYSPPRPEFRVLFNSYYQAVGARHPRSERGLLSRPSLEEVRAWRRQVDAAMGELLAADAGRDPRETERLRARVELGLQHEQQHQELLLTDVKHLLFKNPLQPAYRTGPARTAFPPKSASSASWRAFTGGEVEIGHDPARARRAFAFDNESPRHRVLVPPFELSTRLVTNGEWLAFLEDGGCRRPELWLAEGFDFVQAEAIEAPLYWTRDGAGGRFTQFTLDGTRALDPDEPVCHVSAFEADAFARWAGARLPTEFEWEHAATSSPDLGLAAGGVVANFVESGALHPRGGDSLFGDLWQWTSSAYAPYPGYRAAEGALGEYNGKFMVNQLVLRGGSCVSPRSHLRATYRNYFHAHERWQFMGLRLARDAR